LRNLAAASICYIAAMEVLLPPRPGAAGPPLRVQLDPAGALVHPDTETVFVADVHLGKTRTFREAGAAVPDDTDAEVERLRALVGRWAATTLVVLGDFVHGKAGMAPAVVAAFHRLQAEVAGCRIVVVRGNHDDGHDLVPFGVEVVAGPFAVGPFAAVHEPRPTPFCWTLAGHVHPGVAVGQGAARERVRAFWVNDEAGVVVLPAFASFAGAMATGRPPNARIFAMVGRRWPNGGPGGVVEVTALLGRGQRAR
jgi:uncharacterized protein